MADPATRRSPSSPLDPFLEPFLRALTERTTGYAPAAHGAALADALGWPPAFAEAVFVSACSRGFLEPYRDRAARGRARWTLSERGRSWIARTAPDPAPGADAMPKEGSGTDEASSVPSNG